MTTMTFLISSCSHCHHHDHLLCISAIQKIVTYCKIAQFDKNMALVQLHDCYCQFKIFLFSVTLLQSCHCIHSRLYFPIAIPLSMTFSLHWIAWFYLAVKFSRFNFQVNARLLNLQKYAFPTQTTSISNNLLYQPSKYHTSTFFSTHLHVMSVYTATRLGYNDIFCRLSSTISNYGIKLK